MESRRGGNGQRTESHLALSLLASAVVGSRNVHGRAGICAAAGWPDGVRCSSLLDNGNSGVHVSAFGRGPWDTLTLEGRRRHGGDVLLCASQALSAKASPLRLG
jgi:hypothetical protein